MLHEPYCVALLIADGIHVDPGTQKKTLLGTFNGIVVRSLPVTFPPFIVFGVLSDGEGDIDLSIRIVDVGEMREPVFNQDMTLNMPSRLNSLEFATTVQGAAFEHEDDYRLQLWCRDTLLMERKMVVALAR